MKRMFVSFRDFPVYLTEDVREYVWRYYEFPSEHFRSLQFLNVNENLCAVQFEAENLVLTPVIDRENFPLSHPVMVDWPLYRGSKLSMRFKTSNPLQRGCVLFTLRCHVEFEA